MADPTKQYDISAKQLKLEIARNARRNELRQQLQKLAGDPYRSGTGQGGFPVSLFYQFQLSNLKLFNRIIDTYNVSII